MRDCSIHSMIEGEAVFGWKWESLSGGLVIIWFSSQAELYEAIRTVDRSLNDHLTTRKVRALFCVTVGSTVCDIESSEHQHPPGFSSSSSSAVPRSICDQINTHDTSELIRLLLNLSDPSDPSSYACPWRLACIKVLGPRHYELAHKTFSLFSWYRKSGLHWW